MISELYSSHFLSSLSDPSIDNSGPAALDQHDKEEEIEKNKMKRNKSEKPKHEAKGNFICISFAV